MQIDRGMIARGVEMILEGMGCDHTEEPYLGTPDRVARLLEEIYGDRHELIKVFPEEEYTGPIRLEGHECWSFCPHHMLPTKYTVSVTYVPKQGKVLGLSKLPRLVNQVIYKDGPALQERMTQRICDAIAVYGEHVHVLVRGTHLCTKMRGVKTTADMITEASFHMPQEQ